MGTQERLHKVDAYIQRATELMAAIEKMESVNLRVVDTSFKMADTYVNLANVLLRSVEVRFL